MDVFATAWLYADNDNPGGNAYSTCVVDGMSDTVDGIHVGASVLATVSLSAFSEGVGWGADSVGAVACLIRRWQALDADGLAVDHENLDEALNSVFIDNCVSVTFELAVNFAWAYAQATVFLL